MSLYRLTKVGFSIFLLIALPTTGMADEYFWPKHHETIEYKVKAHAIRGTLNLSLGKQVTIADQTYQELVVETTPDGLPKQNRIVYLRADEQGIYSRYSTSAQDKEIVDLVLPATVGTTWQTFDTDGTPSERKIESIVDCKIKGVQFEGCVEVSYQASGGSAVAVFARNFGEIINSRSNGFNNRVIKLK